MQPKLSSVIQAKEKNYYKKKRKKNDKVLKLKQTHKSLSHDTSQAITDPAEDTDTPGTEGMGRTPATVVVVDRLATEVDSWLL